MLRRFSAGPLAGAPLAIAAGLFAFYCFVLAMSSTPRRVGDGVEYWAMAEQMRTGRLPSATRGELIRLEREAQRIGRGFDQSPVRFEGLVGADGRQDFPHFWLYPLVNVPALALTETIGVHPNWAFTLTNIILITLAFAIVARYVSMAWAALILAGPLIWWIDKAHGDVFTISLLAIGCALWRTAPAWSVITIAIAAAQNPALMPVSVLVSLTALWCAGSRRIAVAVAVAIGASIVAMPLVYYKVHLGVWSPLIGYTHPVWPSMRAMLSLLLDPNIGLLPNAPFLAIAGAWVFATRFAFRLPIRILMPLAGAIWLVLLAAFAQSVNLNHGATPGLNRWTLWLTPWLLLIALLTPSASTPASTPPRTASPRGARLLAALAMLHVLWAGWYFRPSQPEVYRYPTQTAAWLWTHVPRWYEPTPEVFAERVSHREPALLPTATPGCTKVLLIDGRWPAACAATTAAASAPASIPPECLGADRLCYATQSSPTTFTPLGVAAFPWLPAP